MKNRKHFFNEEYFKEIDSEDKAYFLGLLYTDGYNCMQGNYVSIILQYRDKHILDSFIQHISGTHKVSLLKKKKESHQDLCKLQLNSKIFCKILESKGCFQNKTSKLTFPGTDILPEKLVNHFIRGVFDGDGSVWEGKRKKVLCKDLKHRNGERVKVIHNVKFNISNSIGMLKGVQEVLVKNLGFRNNKLNYSKNIEGSAQLEYSGRGQLKKFYDFLYKDSEVFLRRKKDKFDECFIINTDT